MQNRKQEPDVYLTIQDVAFLCGMARHTVQRLIRLEVIEPSERDPEPRFDTTAVARIQKMRRLHVELGVSWSSMPLVLDLLDRIDELQAGPTAGH